jgi:hypothetical protein
MTSLKTPRWFEGVVYTAYGDESADETKQRVFAIAGLFGHKSDWERLEPQWIKLTDGKTFHATECDSDQGAYKKVAHEINKKLYADLTKLIANSNLLGIGVALSLSDYRELLAPLFDDNPYYMCFQSVVIGLAKRSALCIPRDRIEFTFDRNPEIAYNAAALYDRVIKLSPPGFSQLMSDKISFASRETIGIQAADLVAREAMKNLDNQIGPIKRHTRKSTRVLAASTRIKFRLYGRVWCEDLIKYSTKHRYSTEDYYKWIAKHGFNDILATRLKYEFWRKTALEERPPKTTD